ncbi:phosphoribosylamine--glycine ligase [Thermosinus carboxydivorans Nor1]|uniref:Phosphoribosylamine--glycine ligase n=1 Tax=Thermosinus carboxydivorans Nor1 TaxID=401526 RepID=A1HSW5_9FIRM|nr:phosphoribosylamine--glycine ligase [Thermosinus carboxydivorans]EAX46909.1 phosphoribosylamine--glycine ligase [Thermosinus carboxydivorans Nor1]
MRILVIGSGGREHALVWKLAASPRVTQIYCAPGNPGIAALAECVSIDASDIAALRQFALERQIDLTVVGPELPLMQGLADEFAAYGLKVFGPKQAAARIEGSKAFAKALMQKYNIPTAKFAVFEDIAAAMDCIRRWGAPVVVKADGLAAGKGVVVAQTVAEALDAVQTIMRDRAFGAAGNRVVIEEYMEGEEASVLAFTDGYTVVPMVAAQDHKRACDGDHGPNTGGMGAYAPAPVVTAAVRERVVREILQPVVDALRQEGCLYQGCLYAGLMITADGPKVVEFNARFGDPETQAVLPLLASDLVMIMEACVDGRLHEIDIAWADGAAVCVVAAAGGYPGPYRKGDVISGLAAAEAAGALIFHAGTAISDGKLVTSGGRVLGVTACAETIATAVDKAYRAINNINFANIHYRRDIAQRALTKARD